MGGRIEPAEPEPPPAHSFGRADEDVMGRSGQLVRPRSLDAEGEAGGRNWWRGWWVGLFFRRVFDIFGRLGHEKSSNIAESTQTKEKLEKYQKNNQKVGCLLSVLGPKIDKNRILFATQKIIKNSNSRNSYFGCHFPDFPDFGY